MADILGNRDSSTSLPRGDDVYFNSLLDTLSSKFTEKSMYPALDVIRTLKMVLATRPQKASGVVSSDAAGSAAGVEGLMSPVAVRFL